MRDPLNDAAIHEALAGLPGWRHEGDALRKEYAFKGFREAIAFIVRVAFEAEQRDHHPHLSNVYNRVELALTTHDAGDRVTGKDVELARAVEGLA